LTGDFLDLEREIDSFAGRYADRLSPSAHVIIRLGQHAGLVEQLTLIEGKATALREKAAQDRFGLTGRAGPNTLAQLVTDLQGGGQQD